MSRVFSVNKWCFALGPPSAGKWDRFTSWGVKVKDGAESVFNEKNLGQMVENFGNRENDLAMCYDHQSAYVAQNGKEAPALAWYNALALVVDGKIARFASHSPEVKAPDPTGLENGVYGYRSEVTPLGEKLLPNYRYLSPMFTDEGADEAGNEIGYDLMDVAATNTPFQDGVGLTFHKGSAAMRPPKKETYSMAPDLMKRLGLGDDASDEAVKGAMSSQLTKYYAAEDEAKKMADAAASDAKDDEDKDKKDDAKPEAEKMADDAPDEKDKKDEKDCMDDGDDDATAMARSLGLDAKAPLRTMRYAVEAKMVQVREAVAMRAELEKLRAEAAEVRQQSVQIEAERFADEVIGDGRWPEEKRDTIITVYKKNSDDAKSVLFKKGEFTLVRKTFSKSLDRSGPETVITETPGSEGRGAEFSAKAKTYAKEKGVPLAAAQREVAKAHPELYKAYKLGE